MKNKQKKTVVQITYVLRFTQGCLLLALIQGILLLYFNTPIGILVSFLCIGALAYSFRLETRMTINLQKEIKEQADLLSHIRKDIFMYSSIPIIILDKLGSIWWYNENFLKMIGKSELVDKNIRSLFTDLQIENFPKENECYERMMTIQNRQYSMLCKRGVNPENITDYTYTLYFIDTTEKYLLEQQVKNERCLVGYLYIDNYEEIMQSTEEVRRPMLTAIIDRKINLWFKNKNAVISKFDKDKYIIFFKVEDLYRMQERKFDILDELRHIQVGNDLPVTISIGIGRNFETLLASKEDAKAAFDLAIGRGGDQAIIKHHDKYTFYGGKTKEVEKSARVKVRVKAYAFKELLHEADKVYIMGHKNIDMDSLGAAMGVYRAATIMGKKAQIILNEPTYAIQSLYDRIIEAPEYKDIFITHEQAKMEMNKDTLLVVVDVQRRSYVEYEDMLDYTEKVVVFDHHRMSTDFIEDAVLTYIEPFISSTCEMIAEILNYLTDKVKLTQIEADALLAGITIDTKNFVFKAGVRTFEAAAFLRRNGADSTRVRMLFQSDMKMYKIKAAAIKDAQIWKNQIAVSIVDGHDPYANIIAAQVADELLNIKGIESAYVITVVQDDILISARALGDTNVQRVMEILGGGGHKSIAGAQLKDSTVEEAKQKLKCAIEDYTKEGE